MLIFVDFDGVLANRTSSANRYPGPSKSTAWGTSVAQDWYDLDVKCIKVLNRLVDLTGAKVVISSAWREFFNQTNLVAHLKKFGFTGEVVGVTPVIIRAGRDEEIFSWMNSNEKDDYLVLDDEIGHLQRIPDGNMVWVKNGWKNGGLKSRRAKYELTRVLQKRGIEWK